MPEGLVRPAHGSMNAFEQHKLETRWFDKRAVLAMLRGVAGTFIASSCGPL